jgi:hypothetical protein
MNAYNPKEYMIPGVDSRQAELTTQRQPPPLGVCSGCVDMPCMRYTRLCQVQGYAKLNVLGVGTERSEPQIASHNAGPRNNVLNMGEQSAISWRRRQAYL